VASKVRIGEVLIRRESLDATVLLQALRNPPRHPMRLVSSLILSAQLDPEAGALALAEQSGYPVALERHLEHRDPAVKDLVPVELVRQWCVVPLGRTSNGRLVTIACDPTTYLHAALEHATRTPITLAIAPVIHVERLIRSVYGVEPEVPRHQDHMAQPSSSDIGDVKVSVDVERQLREAARATSRPFRIDDAPELPRRRPTGNTQTPIDTTLTQIDQAVTMSAVERLIMSCAASRWQAALLMLVVDDARAVGHRGHGALLGAPETLVLPLDAPSIVRRAIEVRGATADAPRSEQQTWLEHLLGDATTPVAAPIFVANRLHGVFIVGDPRRDHLEKSLADAGRLVDGLAGAYERFSRR
jgi:hypothetical protein